MIYRFQDKHANYCGFIGGIMVSVLVLKAVDCVLIGAIMVSMLVLKVIDHGFIGGRLVCLSRTRYILGSLVVSRQAH
jgi:hypothetical protein